VVKNSSHERKTLKAPDVFTHRFSYAQAYALKLGIAEVKPWVVGHLIFNPVVDENLLRVRP
jgi:hypothetical protein